MSADLTTLVVAVVGVAGTMGAPMVSQRARRSEIREQARRDQQAREQERIDRAFEQRRELYGLLNSSARIYRSAARDVALAYKRGDVVSPEDFTAIDTARESYREYHSHAQMILPQRTLTVAEEVCKCLGHGYELVRRLALNTNPQQASDEVLDWLRGPQSDALHLLGQALREDLGVIEPINDLPALLAKLADYRAEYGAASAID